MKKIPLIICLLFLFPICGHPGQVYIWKDKQGVTHIKNQPPKDDSVEAETMEYKEMQELESRSKRYKEEFDEIKKKYVRKNEELRIEMERNRNFREQDYNDFKRKLENERREREIESAERRYEFLKSKEDTYRKYYHDSNKSYYRDYWYNKTKEVDEARSNLMRLKNQR